MTNDTIKSHPNHPAQVIAEINVVEPNTDATLSFLGVSSGTLTPAFDSKILLYTANIGTVKEILITAIPTDSKATVSGDIGVQQLQEGENVFTITVTAEDKITTKNYIINANPVGITEINNEQLTIKSIEIYDIVGRNVGANLRVRPENNEIIVDVSRFSNGIYIIKLNTNRGIIIKKVIKN